jgi:ATP synthase F1 delta subunit
MAQEFEKGLDVGDVYAAALFALASEAGTVDVVRDELAELLKLTEHDPRIAAFLASVAIDLDDRAASLERMFRGRLSDIVLNTLQVMNRHGRLDLLHALSRAYVLRVEDARGQVEVVATSAVELDPVQRAAITRLAELLAGKRPLVDFVVKPEVLGGVVLQIGDYRYDHSIRRHLAVARGSLLARTTRSAAS